MQFLKTTIPGVMLIDSDAFEDDRGTFVPAWIRDEFESQGLTTEIAQASLVRTKERGTIRGMHYQAEPFGEAKVIRVIRGSVFDVAIDLRPDSATYLRWVGYELSESNRRMMYLPKGCAHGYQTLTPDTDVFYFVSANYSPPHQRGVRWDDPAFAIAWPLGPPTNIHPRDAEYPHVDRLARR